MAFERVPASMTPARLTRLIVIASTVAAAFVEAFLATQYSPPGLLHRASPDSCCCSPPARGCAGGAADRDGRAVPDAGDPARDARRRRELRPRRDLDPAAARLDRCQDRGALAVVAAAHAGNGRCDVGDDRRDRVADRVPARSRLRAVDPAAAARVEHQHRHRPVGSRAERRLLRPRAQRSASCSSMRCAAGIGTRARALPARGAGAACDRRGDRGARSPSIRASSISAFSTGRSGPT